MKPTLVDDLEDCVRMFLRSINLSPALEDTSVGRYANRLRQLGMEPLILKRIEASLVLAFKILFNLVPVITPLFVSLGTVAAFHSVSGSTRGAGALRAHPFPLQLNSTQDGGSTIGASDKSFAHLIARIWNSLTLDAAAYESLPRFVSALESFNWSTIKFVKDTMGTYFEYFSTNSVFSG